MDQKSELKEYIRLGILLTLLGKAIVVCLRHLQREINKKERRKEEGKRSSVRTICLLESIKREKKITSQEQREKDQDEPSEGVSKMNSTFVEYLYIIMNLINRREEREGRERREGREG